MPDLFGHNRQPSAFLVYLYLWCRADTRRGRCATASLQQIAERRRSGVSSAGAWSARQLTATSVPEYSLREPWVR